MNIWELHNDFKVIAIHIGLNTQYWGWAVGRFE